MSHGLGDSGRQNGQMHGASALTRLFTQMFTLPLTAFMYGMEAVVKALQGVQRIAGQSKELIGEPGGVDGSLSNGGDPPSGPGAAVSGAASASSGAFHNSTTKEQYQMPDQDLSGADTLKLVRYKIVFVKRDYEVVFPEREDVVSYDTTGPAWAALKIAEFMGSLTRIPRPPKWREYQGDCDTGCDAVYPPCAPESQVYVDNIPECDRKYIQIFFEVLQRWQREPADYDKQQVQVLRGIRSAINSGVAKI